MKRFVCLFPALFLCLLASGATAPRAIGQGAPTVSADLADHPSGLHRHRVIVQADDAALLDLRRGAKGLLRRDLRGAVALEVNDAQLEELKKNARYAHLSGDLPVA